MKLLYNVAKRIINVLLVLVLSTWQTNAIAQTTEQQLKAAFLYRFAQYTEWPEQVFPASHNNFILCTDAGTEFVKALDIIVGKLVSQSTVQVRKISSAREVSECHMVYVDTDNASQISAYQEQGKKSRVLTVSDIKGFAETGGMIELVRIDNRIQFEINQAAAHQAGIKLSAQLLHLARVVYKDGE